VFLPALILRFVLVALTVGGAAMMLLLVAAR
jgi:hypothetical protein